MRRDIDDDLTEDGPDDPGTSLPRPVRTPRSEMQITQLLPNLMTLAAICAGLTAIRFGIEGNFTTSVRLILLAGVLDGLDGRVARLLKSESEIGAELDSLADFVNFGVAPVLILYFWGLQDMRNEGWSAILIFAVCCVVRLARFNVGARLAVEGPPQAYFVGVPAPAGAVLVMLPMYLAFLVEENPVSIFSELGICIWVVLVGFLMVSRLPTYAFKTLTVSREKARFVMIGFVGFLAALFTYPWLTLTTCSLAYIAGIVFSVRGARRAGRHDHA